MVFRDHYRHGGCMRLDLLLARDAFAATIMTNMYGRNGDGQDSGETVILRDSPGGLAPVQAQPSIERDLQRVEALRGHLPGDRYVRLSRHRDFRRVRAGYLVPREAISRPKSRLGRIVGTIKRLLIGQPLATAAESEERVNRFIGLAIFASDNISSSAYATEEIMRVLVLAGIGALALTLPITLVICCVLGIVVLSYRQVIRAYPSGGGSYIVAKDNLGPLAGLAAGAALLTDYILTVSVSVAAGVAAITSAFPEVFEQRVTIMLLVVGFMTLINLRGIRESGRAFAVPTYIYVVSMLGLLAYGIYRFAIGDLPTYEAPPEWLQADAGLESLGLLLVLRAFASGSVALTGTEAVSNGVPAFTSPSVPNAQTVLVWMGTLFATIFVGISFLAGQLGVIPDPSEAQTVISQLARSLVGDGPYFLLIQFSTAVLLVLAANTSFNGFPRLTSIMATDRFLPRVFRFRGDRLAFTGGIVVLAIISSLLIVAYGGSVTGLIPLYTVGVFIAFTLSQAGLVKHWYHLRDQEAGWRWRAGVNALGAVTTGVVTVEVAVSKFLLGAWMVLLLIPLLIGMMWGIRAHYLRMQGAQRPETPLDPSEVRLRVIVPIAGMNVPARQALAFARAITGDHTVTAVHVTDEPESAQSLQEEWQRSPLKGTNLVIIESPYRSLAGPLLRYIDALHESHPEDTLMIVLPEYVPSHWWEHLLHNQTALRLKAALLFHPGVIVANVPYHLAR
jgi:amino acid transporter